LATRSSPFSLFAAVSRSEPRDVLNTRNPSVGLLDNRVALSSPVRSPPEPEDGGACLGRPYRRRGRRFSTRPSSPRLGDCRKQPYRMARGCRLPTRSGSARIVALCTQCRDKDGRREDKPGGAFVDRNRLSPAAAIACPRPGNGR